MHHPQLNEPRILFQCTENGIYCGEVRPTAFSLGVLIEIFKTPESWHGKYLVYHYSSADAQTPPTEMVSTKIVFKAKDFRNLILQMHQVFNSVPQKIRFTNEERAAIEVACEMKWHFPKKMISELDPIQRKPRSAQAGTQIPVSEPSAKPITIHTRTRDNETDPV